MKTIASITALQLFLTLVVPAMVWADPVVEGVQPKKLKIVPEWTMRTCIVGKLSDLRATYDKEGAIKLRLVDETCANWEASLSIKDPQLENLKKANTKLMEAIGYDGAALKTVQDRNAALQKQVLKEIEEKNKYKYKPNYNWIYITVGAALALAGLTFGVGVWVAKK